MVSKSKKDNFSVPLRPPVVVFLGHVDHGKTSILDFIRQTKIAQKETGQITQHIGAYEVVHHNNSLTLIDTPGHEAFAKMRSRGASLADLAVVVIAVNEGIKPQTKEVFEILAKTKLPYIIALNKIDLAQNQDSKEREIENTLSQMGISLESWGGDVPLVKVSAKTGKGIDLLLETIQILGEIAISENKFAIPGEWGIVLEANVDSKSGIKTILLIKNGPVQIGDKLILDRGHIFKVKNMFNWQGKKINIGKTSQPVTILGLDNLPEVGEVFKKITKDQAGKKPLISKSRALNEVLIDETEQTEEEKKILNLIIKTDVKGSSEAIIEVLKKLSREAALRFKILNIGIGNISEADLKLASSTGAIILAFRVKVPNSVQEVALRNKTKILCFEIIYDIAPQLRDLLKEKNEKKEAFSKKIIGEGEVLIVFGKRKDEKLSKDQVKMIIGVKINQGFLSEKCEVEVVRSGKKIGRGTILQIEKDRIPVKEINQGQEGGVFYQGNIVIKPKDILVGFSSQ